jgi:mannose/fructose/N-acetylgalactosamine-specific phosphotransferase system component IID
LARGVGIITGLTAATWTYASRQGHGFTGFFPLVKHNASHISLILGAGFLGYHFGSTLISAVTGDVNQ